MENKRIIYVLGLGPTLEKFIPGDIPTIGVNDINRKLKILGKNHVCDHIIIQDKPSAFDFDRYMDIIKQPPKNTVYSPFKEYEDCFTNFIHLRTIPYALSILDDPINKFNQWEIPSSLDSTFLACIVATRLGYKEIVIYGADFTNHPRLTDKFYTIKNQYELLYLKLKSQGVKLYCASEKSRLSEVLPIYKA